MDLEKLTATQGNTEWPLTLDPPIRDMFLTGKWDSLNVLLEARDQVAKMLAP